MSKAISTEELDRIFDEGEQDITPFLDMDTARRPGLDDTPRKVNIKMPSWLVDALDREAKHLAITRQAVINQWLAEKAEQVQAIR